MAEFVTHKETPDENGEYFCRCCNCRVEDSSWLCKDCPLALKGEINSIENGFSCRYAEDGEEFPVYWQQGQLTHGMFDEIPQKAIKFAAMAHKGAVRKGNGLPYIVHPMETMSIVSTMTDDVEVMAAAALHDVIEDTKYTGRDIENNFGERVARLVGMESEDKKRYRPAGDTWRERKEENLAREKLAPNEAKMIMLADKLSNMRATLRDYEKNPIGIWEKFNMKDESEQEWYYRSVVKVVEELSDTFVYIEYVKIVDKIFENSDN